MIPFTIFKANVTGDAKNCFYQEEVKVADERSFVIAISCDHVMAKYKKYYRSNDNFIESDCLPFDCDNEHSDNDADWVTPLEVALAFPDVAFAVAYSKSHMKAKGTQSARPRFHVYFPIKMTSSKDDYVALKKEVAEMFPYFDGKAMDAARFMYGTSGEVEFYEGNMTIDAFLGDRNFEDWENSLSEIAEGGRNNAMSHIAGKLIKRYGYGDETLKMFLEQSEKCNPPLPDDELKAIWHSAVKFGKKVALQEGYIPPEEYNSDLKLKPIDFSDVDQARVLAREYMERIAYTPSTDYLVYNGSFWEESKEMAQGLAQELTDRQLEEAKIEIARLISEMKKNGAWELIEERGEKKAIVEFNNVQLSLHRLHRLPLLL